MYLLCIFVCVCVCVFVCVCLCIRRVHYSTYTYTRVRIRVSAKGSGEGSSRVSNRTSATPLSSCGLPRDLNGQSFEWTANIYLYLMYKEKGASLIYVTIEAAMKTERNTVVNESSCLSLLAERGFSFPRGSSTLVPRRSSPLTEEEDVLPPSGRSVNAGA